VLSGARNLAAIVVVAIGAALFAIAFREAVALVFAYVYDAPDVVAAISTVPLAARWILPGIGGALAGVAADRSKGGQGVGDVMEAVVLGRGFLSVVATAWKALGTYLALISGGSIGREGPLIQFGAGLGALSGRLSARAARCAPASAAWWSA